MHNFFEQRATQHGPKSLSAKPMQNTIIINNAKQQTYIVPYIY